MLLESFNIDKFVKLGVLLRSKFYRFIGILQSRFLIFMNKQIILTASLFGVIAVILGAFGAHGLEGKITERHLDTWKTANEYQFYHSLALLFLSTFSRAKSQSIKVSYIMFTLGILLFSGSLYVLSTRNLLGIEQLSFIGPITPLGGVCFIIGWIALFIAALKHRA